MCNSPLVFRFKQDFGKYVTILKLTNLYSSIWNKNPLNSLPVVVTFFHCILFNVLLLNINCLMFIFK